MSDDEEPSLGKERKGKEDRIGMVINYNPNSKGEGGCECVTLFTIPSFPFLSFFRVLNARMTFFDPERERERDRQRERERERDR